VSSVKQWRQSRASVNVCPVWCWTSATHQYSPLSILTPFTPLPSVTNCPPRAWRTLWMANFCPYYLFINDLKVLFLNICHLIEPWMTVLTEEWVSTRRSVLQYPWLARVISSPLLQRSVIVNSMSGKSAAQVVASARRCSEPGMFAMPSKPRPRS
jgi:hypothetical protein